MSRGTIISITGKGGVGKTATTTLTLRTLLESTKNKKILVVDADPATNLPRVLNVPVERTVGMVATELKKRINEGSLSPATAKQELLESWIFDIIVETEKFDLLTMGRTQGEGCYCYVNASLRRIIDNLVDNYDIILMDMEAGLEHLSRRTEHDVDIFVIVTDPSQMGFDTAERILELTKEVHIKFKDMFLLGNRFSEDFYPALEARAKELDIRLAGYIPHDPLIQKYNLEGKPLIELPDDSPALQAMRKISTEIGILQEKQLLHLLGKE
jgi:CO dehydrogenase maturation factor